MRPALLSIAIVWLVAAACDRTRSSTGWDYMPDMYYSQAYESYTSNPNFSDLSLIHISEPTRPY